MRTAAAASGTDEGADEAAAMRPVRWRVGERTGSRADPVWINEDNTTEAKMSVRMRMLTCFDVHFAAAAEYDISDPL